MTIACVLRSGGVYTLDWVWRLKRSIGEHMSMSYRAPLSDPAPGTWTFVCLTDIGPHAGNCRPLTHAWPGWWSKFELFRPGVFSELTLYLDLDTLVVGDLAPFAGYPGELALLSDFSRPKRAQSGVMLFRPGDITEAVWRTWLRSPMQHMRRYRGDGEWLHAHTSADRMQDIYPDRIVSLKKHARRSCPLGATLVCAHGRPKFDDPKAGWAHRVWATA